MNKYGQQHPVQPLSHVLKVAAVGVLHEAELSHSVSRTVCTTAGLHARGTNSNEPCFKCTAQPAECICTETILKHMCSKDPVALELLVPHIKLAEENKTQHHTTRQLVPLSTADDTAPVTRQKARPSHSKPH
jgi:hypothetical protein